MTRSWGVSPLFAAASVLYGILAAYIFCFSGAFGRLGQSVAYDVVLVLVTITASLALGYASMLLIAYRRRRAIEEGDPAAFSWHFLVPCRDEESVVAATVSAARTSFPDAHVWVIDDASEDATATIVAELCDVDPRVHLISRTLPNARTGKGKALNDAYRRVRNYLRDTGFAPDRAIIGVLDADGYLSDNALAVLSGPQGFGDGAVGAAQLEVWMKNRSDKRPRPHAGRFLNALGRYLIRMQDIEFRTSNSAMQLLRSQTGTVGMGGNGQFTRVDVLDRIAAQHGEPWGTKLSEDYELGLTILSLGVRNAYLPDAHVSQEALPYFRRLLTQRTRWGQGILQCRSQLPTLRRSGTLSASGLAEIHYFMAQPWLMLANLLFVPLLTYVAIVNGFFGFLPSAASVLIALAGLVFLVVPYAAWGPAYRSVGGERVGRFASIAYGVGYLCYVYFTYLYYPRAIARHLSGRTAWAKTKRNADGQVAIAAHTPAYLLEVGLLDARVLAELSEDLGGHAEFTREIVSQFIIIWPRRMANLERAVAAEAERATGDAIGSIRVSAAMLGADRLRRVAEEASVLAERGAYDELRELLPRVSRVGEDTVREMRERYVG